MLSNIQRIVILAMATSVILADEKPASTPATPEALVSVSPDGTIKREGEIKRILSMSQAEVVFECENWGKKTTQWLVYDYALLACWREHWKPGKDGKLLLDHIEIAKIIPAQSERIEWTDGTTEPAPAAKTNLWYSTGVPVDGKITVTPN